MIQIGEGYALVETVSIKRIVEVRLGKIRRGETLASDVEGKDIRGVGRQCIDTHQTMFGVTNTREQLLIEEVP